MIATTDGSENTLAQLKLPKRWEFLEKDAASVGLDPAQFVERVDEAAQHIDKLLRRIKTSGGSVFEVIYGLSGSGKTTFLRTLPKFFSGIRVSSFSKELPLSGLPLYIKNSHVPGNETNQIVLIERRDNPSVQDMSAVDSVLAELLEIFRQSEGRVLVLWPITRESDARTIAGKAWDAGRDSVTDAETRGFYTFKGLPKERFFSIADLTTRNLIGDGLESFGITEAVANGLLSGCETISDFFSKVIAHSDEQRIATWTVLTERVRALLWVVLPGDIVTSINATVSALTQGTRSRVDLDLIGEFIDRPDNNAIYVEDWRDRRASMAHLLRAIDLRLFPLPPNVALAAIRAFAEPPIKQLLKQQSVNIENAKDAMKASRLYKAILAEAGLETTPFAGARETSDETSNEYRRIQAQASKNDKPLNIALSKLIAACLADDAPSIKVVSEKRSLPNSNLQPDIQILISPKNIICLEPTWRSTDLGIPGEIDGGQNTLTEAHLKKYVLDKATQYVKGLGL